MKHAMPDLRPEIAAKDWTLSESGRDASRRLAQKLAPYDPAVIIGSLEPKATETAEIVAGELSLPFKVANDLHEHDRTNVPFETRQGFESKMRTFFEKPEVLTFGQETALEAQERFVRAIDEVLERHPDGNLVVVAHGTVISLLAGARAGTEPFELWQTLGLPSYLVFSLPEFALLETVGSAA